jgi:hypothetical protein
MPITVKSPTKSAATKTKLTWPLASRVVNNDVAVAEGGAARDVGSAGTVAVGKGLLASAGADSGGTGTVGKGLFTSAGVISTGVISTGATSTGAVSVRVTAVLGNGVPTVIAVVAVMPVVPVRASVIVMGVVALAGVSGERGDSCHWGAASARRRVGNSRSPPNANSSATIVPTTSVCWRR